MPVERKEYEFAPAGPTYSRGVKAGNLLFISGCTARGTDAQARIHRRTPLDGVRTAEGE